MRILTRGAGFANKGAESMLLTTRSELERRIGKVTFQCEIVPCDASAATSAGFQPVENQWPNQSYLVKVIHLLRCIRSYPKATSLIMSCPGLGLKVASALRGCDAVLDISGYAYAEGCGTDCAEEAAFYSVFCSCIDMPCVFMPQAWGPFCSERLVNDMKRLVSFSSATFARDKVSLSNLEGLETNSKIREASDIAFLFEGASREVGMQCIENVGLDVDDKPMIGVTPNSRIYDRTEGKGADNIYVRLMTRVVNGCLQLGASVLLVPHETSVGQRGVGDKDICEMIANQFSSEESVGVCADTNVKALKAVIGNLDMLVGSRYHSIVAAVSQNVPVVVVSWSHKYGELLSDVGLDDAWVDFRETNEDAVVAMLRREWAKRKDNVAILNRNVPTLCYRVNRFFDDLAAMIRA